MGKYFQNEILQRFVPQGAVDNKSSLVQVMVWHPTGDKPLSEALMAQLALCITRLLREKSHRNGKVVRMTVLVFTGDVEACLQRLQWISGLSPWRPFRFSGSQWFGATRILHFVEISQNHRHVCCPITLHLVSIENCHREYVWLFQCASYESAKTAH